MHSPGDADVGWTREVNFHFEGAPPEKVDVTLGTISEEDAAFAFVAYGLALALPLFAREPLHGSAVATPDGALLLLGASARGKSSLAHEMTARGFPLVDDDTCAVDGELLVWPALPLIGLEDGPPNPLREFDGKGIYAVPASAPRPLPIRAVAVLSPADGRSLTSEPISGTAAFGAVLEHVRAPWAFTEDRRRLQMDVVAGVSTRECRILNYDLKRHSVAEVADHIIENVL